MEHFDDISSSEAVADEEYEYIDTNDADSQEIGHIYFDSQDIVQDESIYEVSDERAMIEDGQIITPVDIFSNQMEGRDESIDDSGYLILE